MSTDLQTVVANVLTSNTDTFVSPALQGLVDTDLLKRPWLYGPPSQRCKAMPRQYEKKR